MKRLFGASVTVVLAGAMALLAGGGYAEQVVVDAGSAMKVPTALSWSEAGAIPEVFLTAFLNIFLLGEAQRGASVLVHRCPVHHGERSVSPVHGDP